MKIDNDKIISYLSDELSKEDRAAFELKLLENKELKLIIDELNTNDIILQNMPKYKTSLDFMIGLTAKIDAYEKSNIWYIKIFNQVNELDIIPKLAVTSVMFLLSFTLIKINSSNNNNLSNSIDNNQDLIAIADDSLSQQADSLFHDPTLLISKNK